MCKPCHRAVHAGVSRSRAEVAKALDMLRWVLRNWASVTRALGIPERSFYRFRDPDSFFGTGNLRRALRNVDKETVDRARVFAKEFREGMAVR